MVFGGHLSQLTAKVSSVPKGLKNKTKPCCTTSRFTSFSATLAGLYDHVGELLHFGGSSRVVQYSEGLQVLRDAAGGGGGFRVQSVVQAQELQDSTKQLLCLMNYIAIESDQKAAVSPQSCTLLGYATVFKLLILLPPLKTTL